MTFSNWLSPDVMRPAGWALLHFLWQGTALAALAAVAMAPFRKATARYTVAVAVLLLMLAAPAATFFYYRSADSVQTWNRTAPVARLHQVASWPVPAQAVTVISRSAAYDLLPLMVQLWLVGVAAFSLRSAGGFLLLERMRRRQSLDVDTELRQVCLALQRQLGLSRAIRYAQCQWLQAPAVIGWFRPIVFLPFTALTGLSEEQLQLVIAHELAHIKRLDSFVNAFQVVVETLLFYHPAVWWLNKRIRLEREICCDDVAIALCGNAMEYARALTLMEEWRVAPALAMAANRGPLTERVTRLLGIDHLRSGVRGIGLTSSALCLTVALLAGNAIFGFSHKASAQATPPSPVRPAKPVKPARAEIPAVKNTPTVNAPSTPVTPTPVEPVKAASYIEEMKVVGLGTTDVDQLIALKVQGVTPEYVQGLQAQGLRLAADEIIAMKVQGVTPEYIRDVRATGMKVSEDEIIGMKVQGVDANYIHGLQELGLKPDADEVIGMKVQGVTPEYVRAMKSEGIETSGDEVIAMRVQGVTPEYVRGIRALGFKPSADEIIAMRVQDVTPEYLKALQTAGFKFDIDDAVGAKVQGVTPEFIEKVRQHGFKDLTLEKLIHLRQLGVLDRDGEI
jgi:beta-lactamase regulating signal transducer with metallopeptidase domain